MKLSSIVKKAAILVLFSILILQIAKAQNVAITDDDTYSANDAAMLDIKSNTKGLLIPRVSLVSAHVPISASKPEGLLIWNSSPGAYTVGYYFWNGTDWSPVGAAVGNGLTLTGSKIELGGTLEKTTMINTAGNLMEFNVNGSNMFKINLSSTGDFDIQDNGSSAFFVGDNGSVGVGTISPLHTMHISGVNSNTAGTDGVYIDIQNAYDNTYEQAGIRFGNNSTTSNAFRGGIFFRRTNSPLSVDGDIYLANKSGANVSYADAALIVKPDRKIGIGTGTPTALLHVNGDMKLATGAAVNEFSIDGTLVGNSDLAVPTEKATKTYVDSKAGAGFSGTGTLNYIPRWTSTTGLGSSIMYQNTNKIGIGTTTPSSKLEVFGNNGLTDDDAIFEVKNDAGQTVFAVYPKGVRMYVDESLAKDNGKGTRGGFAVGNLAAKAGEPGEEYFRVTRDSVRVNVSPTAKGTRGGFAVGNLAAKGTTSIMQIEKENYFIGQESGIAITTGLYNTFFGYQAGNMNTAGSSNVFIGYQSGFSNIDAQNNVFIGIKAGYSNIGGTSWNGDDNVFIGNNAGYSNTIGHDNVYLGNNAGKTNTQFYNVAIGSDAGASSTSAFNTFLGNGAGQVATGGGNTYLGMASGRYNTTGSSNVYVGSRAGFWNTTGSNNVLIGYGTGELANGQALGNNNIFIGYDAGDEQVGVSDKLIIESSNSTTPLIYGDFAADNLTINGNELKLYNSAASTANISIDGNTTNIKQLVFKESGVYQAGFGWEPVNNYVFLYDTKNSFVSKNGNIGINNTNPTTQLDVIGNTMVTGSIGVNTSAISSRSIYSAATGTSVTYAVYGYATSGTNNRGIYGYASGGTYNYAIYGSASAVANSYAGYFSGNVYISGTTTKSSDARLKKNVETISGALTKLNQINGVSYNWKSHEELQMLYANNKSDLNSEEIEDRTHMSAEKQIGVIAQDVEKVIPELVMTDEMGFKSVNYEGLIPVLIQAIKEQQQQIDNQNIEIEKLKALLLKSSVKE